MSKITTVIRVLKLAKYLDVKYLKRAFVLTLCYNILKVVCLVGVLVPLHNSYVANQIENDLLETPLPENTVFIESINATGKLTGSGSNINFFGGMLIKSELTEDELNEYYSEIREDRNDYLIESQDTAEISVIENGDYSFERLENVSDFDNYYLVYSWGSDESVLQNFNKFDFRTLKFNA